MQTFDQSLMSHVRKGLIGYQEALRQASNPDDFALRYSGISSTSDSHWDDFDNGAGAKTPANASPQPGARANTPAPKAPATDPDEKNDEFKIDRF